MKSTNEMLNEIINEKQLKERTIINYKQSINLFEKHIQMTIPELMEKQEIQRKQGILWKNTILKEKLVSFRNYLHEKYKSSTATVYYGQIIAIFNYFDVEIGKIRPIKRDKDDLNFSGDLPTREEIQQCINSVDSPIIKAVALFLSSTGLSPVDALKLTISDLLEATKEYHNFSIHHNIRTAIHEMKDQDIIPMFVGHRQKSSQQYVTFASHEAIKAINIYLLSREDKLTVDSLIFNQSQDNIKVNFRRINNQLNLGTTKKGHSRFCMKNMRAFHTNQLKKAGLDIGEINVLEGRKNNNVIWEHYITIDEKELREKYIKALPFILVEDINKVKSELDNVKEELEVKTVENKQLTDNLNSMWDEIKDMKNRQDAWEQIKNEQLE